MGSEADGKKHRSIPEDAEDGERSKRRKHRHHHKHHKHHSRRHRRNRGEKEEKEVENEVSPSSPGAESPDDISLKRSPAIAVEPRVAASVEIDDMEEGEILEEELPEAKEFVPDQEQSGCFTADISERMSLEGVTDDRLDASVDVSCPHMSAKKDNFSCNDEEYGRSTGHEAKHFLAGLTLEENGFYASGMKESERETASRSPVSGGSLGSLKERKKDSQKSRKRSDSRCSLGDEDKHKAGVHSSSHTRHHRDGHSREKSLEQGSRSGMENADHFRSDSRDRVRDDADYERGSKRHRTKDQDSIDSRHRRHDRYEDKYDTSDRGRDRERGPRDRGEFKDSSRDMERDSYREREKSKDTSREENRRKSGDSSRDRERDRYGEREKSLGTRGEKESDREKTKMSSHRSDRERNGLAIRYSDSGRDWEKDLDKHRDRHREMVRNHERHKDSRNSTYDESRHLKDSKEIRRPSSQKEEEEMRDEQGDDYEEKIEQQLAEQEEDDPEKIMEESRRRRLAILEKYKQKQVQLEQQLEVPLFEDHGKGEKTLTAVFSVEKSPLGNNSQLENIVPATGGLGAGTPKGERSDDMFCDDIFGESPSGVRKSEKGDDLKVSRSGLHDNWDDAEGYYAYRFGEVLDGRYEVIASHGKGVFSIVVRAKDLKAEGGDPEEVAIKIIRNNETMYKAGMGELTILKKLAGADPDDRRHCVRFLSSFKYRNHLCLVFESLHMNLREVLKKFGRNIGLKLTAVRVYAKQLFIALKHLKNCGVLHCDIKPDNMLVNEAKNVLKLCDFGNAMFAGKNEITPYLVSRFYRAPEIILGLQYDHPMDIWSVGCCLYELYAGKVLFPGPSNNDMLRLHMELKGPFPKKMLRKGAFVDHHFDQDLNFHATEEDPVTKKTVKRMLVNMKPKDFNTLLTTFPGEDPKLLAQFKDLLERIFMLDPEKRMTVAQALSHPFITGK